MTTLTPQADTLGKRIVLFDLDGTLVDSRRGIVTTLHETITSFGVTVEENHDYSWCIGASLWKIFAQYLETDDRPTLDEAVRRYREIYGSGPMFDFDVYDGVVNMLSDVKSHVDRVVIATAKTHSYARTIVASAPFAPYIDVVYGSELDGTRAEKADLILHVLTTEGFDPSAAIMVGDRYHDVEGAARHGVNSIGVTYGYGREEELHRATTIVHTASAISTTVRNLHARSSRL